MANEKPLELCAGETVLLQLGNALTLTSHRVRLDQRSSGGSRMVSMTLRSVASCGIVTNQSLLLLALSMLLAMIGAVATQIQGNIAALLLVAAAITLGFYFATRRVVLAVASAGERIIVPVAGSGREPFAKFVDALERAQLQRESALEEKVAESGPSRTAGYQPAR